MSHETDGPLVVEAQCFLDGNYLEIAFTQDRDVPSWAWISILAHGDISAIERATYWRQIHGAQRPEYDTWGRVLEHSAAQLLETFAVAKCPLDDIQRALLIPLELTIMVNAVGPTTLYRLTSSMLSEFRRRVESERR